MSYGCCVWLAPVDGSVIQASSAQHIGSQDCLVAEKQAVKVGHIVGRVFTKADLDMVLGMIHTGVGVI